MLVWDRYAYVNNNPVKYTDTTGHCIDGVTTALCIAIAAGAIAGYAVQVGENRAEGMDWGAALTTDISVEKILGGAVLAGGVVFGAAVVGTIVAVGTAAAGTAGAIACADGDCSNEVKAVGNTVATISNQVSTSAQTTTNTTTAIQPYYPPMMGFSGTPQVTTLQQGTLLSRFGSPYGSFLSPAGTPNWARALPPGVENMTLHTYEVTKPIENVLTGSIAPWWGQIGGGVQYFVGNPHGQNIQKLLDSGYLQEIW